MKRTYDLKRKETKTLPPEKLQEILSRIYPEGIVDELMEKLVESKINRQKAEIERLNNNLNAMYATLSNSARATRHEAITEFAECVKKHQVMLFNEIYSNKGFADAIDNLVKEMVGDNNA